MLAGAARRAQRAERAPEHRQVDLHDAGSGPGLVDEPRKLREVAPIREHGVPRGAFHVLEVGEKVRDVVSKGVMGG
jgi:hypothetical protein